MTIQLANGTFVKPYSYNQCPTKGCYYELPVGTPLKEWPELVRSHVNEAHEGKSIWTTIVKP